MCVMIVDYVDYFVIHARFRQLPDTYVFSCHTPVETIPDSAEQKDDILYFPVKLQSNPSAMGSLFSKS